MKQFSDEKWTHAQINKIEKFKKKKKPKLAYKNNAWA